MTLESDFLDALTWNQEGLIPAIVQDAESSEVLMMAWMDRAAIVKTIESGQTHFYSRSRKAAWHKGGTSGHVQHVREIRLDCDADTLLIRVDQVGGACHEGFHSCFSRKLVANGELVLDAERVFSPADVYNGKKK